MAGPGLVAGRGGRGGGGRGPGGRSGVVVAGGGGGRVVGVGRWWWWPSGGVARAGGARPSRKEFCGSDRWQRTQDKLVPSDRPVVGLIGMRSSPQFNGYPRYPEGSPMGDAVADLEDPNQDRAGVVDVSSRSIDTAPSSDLNQTGPEPSEFPTPSGWRRPQRDGSPPQRVPQLEDGSLGLDDQRSKDSRTSPRQGGISDPLVLEDLLLLDRDGKEPIRIDTLTFADDGIGVTRSRGDGTRILPWSSVVSHVVEAWSGGITPEWWVDPELNRSDPNDRDLSSVTDPGATNRPLPHIERRSADRNTSLLGNLSISAPRWRCRVSCHAPSTL